MKTLLHPTKIEFEYNGFKLRSSVDQKNIVWFNLDDLMLMLGAEENYNLLKAVRFYNFSRVVIKKTEWVNEACLHMIVFNSDCGDEINFIDRIFAEVIRPSVHKLKIQHGRLIA